MSARSGDDKDKTDAESKVAEAHARAGDVPPAPPTLEELEGQVVAHTTAITDDGELKELRRRLANSEYLGDNIVYAPYSPNEFQRIPDKAVKLLAEPPPPTRGRERYLTPERLAISAEHGVHDPAALVLAGGGGAASFGNATAGGTAGRGTSSTAGDTAGRGGTAGT